MAESILATPMQDNDAGAKTVGEYLSALLLAVLEEGEGFNGKRPFGNSGWELDIIIALAQAGILQAALNEDGYLEDITDEEEAKGWGLVFDAISGALEVTCE